MQKALTVLLVLVTVDLVNQRALVTLQTKSVPDNVLTHKLQTLSVATASPLVQEEKLVFREFALLNFSLYFFVYNKKYPTDQNVIHFQIIHRNKYLSFFPSIYGLKGMDFENRSLFVEL